MLTFESSSTHAAIKVPYGMKFSQELNFADCQFFAFHRNKFWRMWTSDHYREPIFADFGQFSLRYLKYETCIQQQETLPSLFYLFTVLMSRAVDYRSPLLIALWHRADGLVQRLSVMLQLHRGRL